MILGRWSKTHSLTLVATGIKNSNEVGIIRKIWTMVEAPLAHARSYWNQKLE